MAKRYILTEEGASEGNGWVIVVGVVLGFLVVCGVIKGVVEDFVTSSKKEQEKAQFDQKKKAWRWACPQCKGGIGLPADWGDPRGQTFTCPHCKLSHSIGEDLLPTGVPSTTKTADEVGRPGTANAGEQKLPNEVRYLDRNASTPSAGPSESESALHSWSCPHCKGEVSSRGMPRSDEYVCPHCNKQHKLRAEAYMPTEVRRNLERLGALEKSTQPKEPE